jgi:hypothetical protein
MIKILFDATDSHFQQLQIKINDQLVNYAVSGHEINIDCYLNMGIHQLSVQLIEGSKFSVRDVLINTVSIRQTIYLSYITHGNKILQPATTIWDKDQTWHLPFANPVSFWISLVTSKLPSNILGQDLYKKYNIIYPSKIYLKNPCTQLIKDFFEHNFDFFCEPKSKIELLPVRPTKLKISDYDTESVINEIFENFNFIKNNQIDYSQKKYNLQEGTQTQESWISFQFTSNGQILVDPEKFPCVLKLINSLPVNHIKRVKLGILPPGASISPHTDRVDSELPGCGDYNLYFPLNWTDGNYFKFQNGGLITSGEFAWLVNNSDHVHALVNHSNEYRHVLSIIIDPKMNDHLIANEISTALDK